MPNLLDKIRAALKRPSPTSALLADALADAQRADLDARAAVDKAAAAVAGGFMDAIAKRQADRDALAKAREDAEDTGLVLAEVERRHAAALAADEQERRRAVYDGAKAQAGAAAIALAKTYPTLARGIVAMLKDLATAQHAVEAANAELPDGAVPLVDPEFSARGVAGLPREVVAEEEVVLWAYDADMRPAPDDMQADIVETGDGWGRAPGAQTPFFRRRRFLKRQVREATYSNAPSPLAATIQLPAVTGGGMLWDAAEPWQATDIGAADVLARVAAFEAAAVMGPTKAVRPVKVEMQDLGEVAGRRMEQEAPDMVGRSAFAQGSRFGASPFARPGSRPARSA